MPSHTKIILTCLCFFSVLASAQEGDDGAIQGSRDMQAAVHLYETGDDMGAMDHFLEILTRGDPSERATANDYINLITQRMNTELPPPVSPPQRPRVSANAVAIPAPTSAPAPVPAYPPAAAPPVSPVFRSEAPIRVDKAAMHQEIKAKIQALLDTGLSELRAFPKIRVLVRSSGEPDAIAIPTPLLFENGITFQKDAKKILESVAKIAMGLGSAQIAILPEGAFLGDSKISDMRRTMGVSSYLLSAGLAAPRVRVNLLSSEVDIPKPLAGFKGVILLFDYEHPMTLSVDNEIGLENGPPLSMGVYPPDFRPGRGEGVIVEFSVQEPPEGIASWRFRLLRPRADDGTEGEALQQVIGAGSVFHQIYWNGRLNYFGEILPAGRYECALTATDGKNRQRTLRRWIDLVLPASSAAVKPPAPPPAPAPPAVEPPQLTVVEIGKPKLSAVKNKKSKPRTAAKRKGKTKAKSVHTSSLAAAAMGSGISLACAEGSHELTPESDGKLADFAKALALRPASSLSIQGTAKSAEPDADKLAEQRAQMAAGLLVNKYQVDPKRITINSTVSDSATPGVRIESVSDGGS